MTRVNEGSSHPGYSLSRGLSEATMKGGGMLLNVKILTRQRHVLRDGKGGRGGSRAISEHSNQTMITVNG